MNYFLPFLFLVIFSCESPSQNGEIASENGLTDTIPKHARSHDTTAADLFRGEIRSEAKTSFVNAVADTFESIKKLQNWLPSDEYMHKSTYAKHNNTPRTSEENHNVYLDDLYIFGVKKEDDNDYHLILASSKKLEKDQPYFSAEISGLPDSTSKFFSTLSTVRNTFLSYFGADANKEYVFVASAKHPPIHLLYIKGSLFFDNHHFGAPSSVKGFKVCSAWEIHPVTAIEFDGDYR